jgi:hypothetical protein
MKLDLFEAVVSLFLVVHIKYLDQFESHAEPIGFPLSFEDVGKLSLTYSGR